MSIKLMSRVWELELPHNEKLILLALADHANDDGYCYPSIKRIAWKTDYSERTVQRVIASLCERDVVWIEEEASGAPGKPRIYGLDLNAIPQKPPFETGDNMSPLEDEGVTPVSPTGDIHDATGDISRARGDIAVSPESSIEPSVEPSLTISARASQKKRTQPRTPKGETCPSCNSSLSSETVGLYCAECGLIYAEEADSSRGEGHPVMFGPPSVACHFERDGLEPAAVTAPIEVGVEE